MLRLPKVVEGKDIIKVLVKYGYEIKRRKGSHVSLSKEEINITVVLPLTTIGVYRKISKKQEYLLKNSYRNIFVRIGISNFSSLDSAREFLSSGKLSK